MKPRRSLKHSVADVYQRTHQLFDSDGDGRVTKFELKEALWSLGQHPGEEELDAMFHEYDTNQSQDLDYSEFRRSIMTRLSYKVFKKND